MTDRLKETFNLPELEEILDDLRDDKQENNEETDDDSELEEIKKGLAEIDYTGIATHSEDGIDELETEMDKVIEEGMNQFKDLVNYAYNVEEKNAAGILSSAAKILEIASNASKTKQEQKMKLIRLKMEQELQDHNIAMSKGNVVKGEVFEQTNSQGKVINRSEYLRTLKNKGDEK